MPEHGVVRPLGFFRRSPSHAGHGTRWRVEKLHHGVMDCGTANVWQYDGEAVSPQNRLSSVSECATCYRALKLRREDEGLPMDISCLRARA